MPTPTLSDRVRQLHNDQSGSATVEYILISVLLLIPLVYAMIAIHHVQTASYAAAAAADHGAKIAGGLGGGRAIAQAQHSIDQTVQDYRIDTSRVRSTVSCAPSSCGANARIITYQVSIDVPVPVFDSLLGRRTTIASVHANASAPISEVDE